MSQLPPHPTESIFLVPRLNGLLVQFFFVATLSHSVLIEYLKSTQGHLFMAILVIWPIPVNVRTNYFLVVIDLILLILAGKAK